MLLACRAWDGLAVSCGVCEQLGEQRRRLALQRGGERFQPRARETHAIISTYTFMHNLFSAGGLTGLGTTERCDRSLYVTADQHGKPSERLPTQKGRSNPANGTNDRPIVRPTS